METNKTFIRCKKSLKSKLRSDLLSRLPHHFIPGMNMSRNQLSDETNIETVFEKFQEYPYSCDFPKPLLPPSKPNREFFSCDDVSTQLITVKQKNTEDVNRFTSFFEKNKSKLKLPRLQEVNWIDENGKEFTNVPRYVAELAEIVEQDPDPHFSGLYNWYYTGGTINSINIQERNILLLPYSKELTAIPIYAKGDSICWPDLKYSASITLDDVLYETVCNVSNNVARVLARYKNSHVLYNLSTEMNGKLSLMEIQKQSSKIPYISIDLSSINESYYCTANVEREVALWDMLSQKQICKTKVPIMRPVVNNWSNIKFREDEPNTLIYIDSSCLHYLDIRLPIDRPVLSMYLTEELETCESLSSHVSSSYCEFYSYVGSYHSLLLCDKRQCKDSIIHKWTHQFKSPPLFVDVCKQEIGETVVLGSQIAGETSIVLNTWDMSEKNLESYIMPFTPVSIMETLSTSQSRGKCLNPLLKERIKSCNTGYVLTKDSSNGDILLFYQNSNNDVFYQGITHDSIFDLYSVENCKSLYALEAWEQCIKKHLHDEAVSPCVLNERINTDHIRGYMKNKKLRASDEVDTIDIYGSWHRSFLHLSSCIDILAPELLAAWEIREDASFLVSTAAPNDKVLDWLEKAGISNETGISQLIPTPSGVEGVYLVEKEDASEGQASDLCEIVDEAFDYLLPKVNTKKDEEKQRSKIYSQYTPGF